MEFIHHSEWEWQKYLIPYPGKARIDVEIWTAHVYSFNFVRGNLSSCQNRWLVNDLAFWRKTLLTYSSSNRGFSRVNDLPKQPSL